MKIALTLGARTTDTHCGDCPHASDQRGWFCDAFGGVRLFANHGESPIRRDECLSAQRAFDDAIRGAKAEGLRACLAIAKERAEVGFFPPDAQRESIDWTQVEKEVEGLCRD